MNQFNLYLINKKIKNCKVQFIAIFSLYTGLRVSPVSEPLNTSFRQIPSQASCITSISFFLCLFFSAGSSSLSSHSWFFITTLSLFFITFLSLMIIHHFPLTYGSSSLPSHSQFFFTYLSLMVLDHFPLTHGSLILPSHS